MNEAIKISELKNRTLFLWLNENDFYPIQAKKRGYNVRQTYKRLNVFDKIIRRFFLRFNFLLMYPFIGNWKKELNNYDSIIIHASILAPPVVRIIHFLNPKIRIIVWYWNPIDKCCNINRFPKDKCEIWSFDEKDVKTYKVRHNTQYFFNDIKLTNEITEFDLLFVGGDKGRLAMLLNLKEFLEKNNISVNLHVTKTKDSGKFQEHHFKQRITYSEILKLIGKSNAILDFVSTGQTGLTIRPLEALFFGKKLITNDEGILARDLYDKNNIFVFNGSNYTELTQFLKFPYNYNNVELLKKKYDIDEWFLRFFQ